MKNTVNVRIKRGIVFILVALLLCSATVGFAGCENWKEDRYTEDFIYRKYFNHIEIKGLTDVGKTKEVLIIPDMIEDKLVTFCYELESETLKKIYRPWMKHKDIGKAFVHCANLEKVICWGNLSPVEGDNNEKGSIRAYICRGQYAEDTEHGSNVVYEAQNDKISSYFANIRYVYVDGNGTIMGYGWLDDYDYGSRITYVPKDIQGDWYKEPECINKWDFDVDTLPEEVVVDGVVQYQETVLYKKLGG